MSNLNFNARDGVMAISWEGTDPEIDRLISGFNYPEPDCLTDTKEMAIRRRRFSI